MPNILTASLERLQRRVDELNKEFPHSKTNITDYVNGIIKRHLDRKDHEERTGICNSGVAWKIYRRNNFSAIYRRDSGCCKYCRRQVTKRGATLDHVVSPLRGGTNCLENLNLSCYWCNQDKGMLTDEEYYYKQLVNASKGIKPE